MGVAAIAFGTLAGLFGGMIASLLFPIGFWDVLAAVGALQLALVALLLAGPVVAAPRSSARRADRTRHRTGATVARLFRADAAHAPRPQCQKGERPCETCPYRGARGC